MSYANMSPLSGHLITTDIVHETLEDFDDEPN
jgi:hypothetical protein